MRLVLAAAVAIAAVTMGVAFALAVSGIRQPTTGAASSATALPSASVSPSIMPSASPTSPATPTPTPVITPTPVPTPTGTPLPTATPTPPPAPLPGSCEAHEFVEGDITISTLAELEKGMVGTWEGCVITPWVRPYWVTLTFYPDGTYSSRAEDDAPDGNPAMYYGTDDDSPEKRWELNDLQDDLEGVGQIDIVFWPGNTNRGDLRNIRLMGHQLEFEFFHRGAYGPLMYQLYRVAPTE